MLLWWLGLLSLVCGGLAACPHHCSCFTDPDGYVSGNCSVQALGQLEPSHVEMLSFQPRLGGYPTSLEPRAFLAFQRTKFLWMVNCSVLNLPNDVFHGLVYVIRLDLSYNKIRHLNGAVFKPLSSLTTLKLRSNPLELTPWDVIVSDSLQELDLGHCRLRTVPFGTFVGVPRLSRLYLDGNELRTLTYNTIPTTLRYVNLARNRISTVPTEILTSMSHLRKIDLSKNPVNCTCNLLIMQDWFSGQGVILDNGVTCVEPSQYKGMRLSKINENELCTLEEVKRQRRINDIQSYRDSKSHRTDNMIHDPNLQSDQPNGQNYAEVLFPDDGLTHMEMSGKHYSVLPTDHSDENNKVVESKQEGHSVEMDLAPPTRIARVDGEEESSKEEIIIHEDTSESTKDIDLQEAAPTESQKTTHSDHIPFEHIPSFDIDETTNSSIIDHTGIATTYINSTALTDITNSSMTTHDDLAEEGYSPVYNMTDLMLSDSEGSGDESLMTNSFGQESKNNSHTTPETFTFPSSLSDSTDYNYDSHHDYSSEVTGSTTTESMNTFEGSGEPENETISSSNIPPIWRDEEEENETTTETFLKVDNTTSNYFDWTSEDHEDSSTPYSTSSESYMGSIENSTSEGTTEVFTSSEASSSVSPIDVYLDISSSESPTSSSESPTSSSESPASSSESATSFSESPASSSLSPTSISESPASSSEAPSSSSESSESPPSSTESSSSVSPLFPVISTGQFDIFPESDGEETTTASQSSTEDVSSSVPITVTPSTSAPSSSSPSPVSEVEVIKKTDDSNTKEEISVGPSEEERPVQSTLTYVIVGLLVALIMAVALALICKKVSGSASKKKVRLPADLEASPGTELQDMLLPRPAENGVKILAANGKEEEKPVLTKDWDDKNEPIETVTARLTVLAGPQTPVFIHKTLA